MSKLLVSTAGRGNHWYGETQSKAGEVPLGRGARFSISIIAFLVIKTAVASGMSNSGSNDKALASGEGSSRRDADGEMSSAGSTPPAMSLTSDEVNYLVFRYVSPYTFLQTCRKVMYD